MGETGRGEGLTMLWMGTRDGRLYGAEPRPLWSEPTWHWAEKGEVIVRTPQGDERRRVSMYGWMKLVRPVQQRLLPRRGDDPRINWVFTSEIYEWAGECDLAGRPILVLKGETR